MDLHKKLCLSKNSHFSQKLERLSEKKTEKNHDKKPI